MERWLRSLVFLLAGAASGCSDGGRECYPYDWERCSCDAATQGYRQCDQDGAAYGACDCSGTIPGLSTGAGTTTTTTTTASGTGGGGGSTGGSGGSTGGSGGSTGGSGGNGGAGGSGLLPFLSPCTTNEECETGLCYNFTTKGPHCTMPCTMDSECPPPSLMCTPKGVCKLP